jgi:nicotinamidase-related amidase
LDELLREFKVEAVILTGVLTNICIQHTAADAYFRGYKITVPRDCVDALTDAEQADSLAFMKRMYGAEVTDSATLIRGLEVSN